MLLHQTHLTLTRVVFEYKQQQKPLVDDMDLTLTRVVFEFDYNKLGVATVQI